MKRRGSMSRVACSITARGYEWRLTKWETKIGMETYESGNGDGYLDLGSDFGPRPGVYLGSEGDCAGQELALGGNVWRGDVTGEYEGGLGLDGLESAFCGSWDLAGGEVGLAYQLGRA